jgi:hypothetical protein
MLKETDLGVMQRLFLEMAHNTKLSPQAQNIQKSAKEEESAKKSEKY